MDGGAFVFPGVLIFRCCTPFQFLHFLSPSKIVHTSNSTSPTTNHKLLEDHLGTQVSYHLSSCPSPLRVKYVATRVATDLVFHPSSRYSRTNCTLQTSSTSTITSLLYSIPQPYQSIPFAYSRAILGMLSSHYLSSVRSLPFLQQITIFHPSNQYLFFNKSLFFPPSNYYLSSIKSLPFLHCYFSSIKSLPSLHHITTFPPSNQYLSSIESLPSPHHIITFHLVLSILVITMAGENLPVI